MGKRSNFERVERDFYPTPFQAVKPLLPHLSEKEFFVEPCAGDGTLVDHLEKNNMKCIFQSDIEPRRKNILELDVFKLDAMQFLNADLIITNPPWDRKILHPLILHCIELLPTWLLFDADWMHTKQAADYLPYLKKIVSVGRVKWIPDSESTGKDNCCWYYFDRYNKVMCASFYGRLSNGRLL